MTTTDTYRGPGRLATLTRAFGWSMLVILPAYLVNSVLTISFDWPGVGSLLAGTFSPLSIVQLLFYVLGVAAAVTLTLKYRDTPLRVDSERVSSFNAWLVRAAFFGVVFVGLADMLISLLRVEDFLPLVVGDDLSRQLGRSSFRGLYVHVPLLLLGIVVASITRTLGFIWLTLLIVLAELMIVFSRFVFSYEQTFMGDLVRFWYAALFLFASAYTLIEDGHVRVDVLYASFTRRSKGIVNSIGTLLLGMTLCWTILIVGLGSKSSIVYAPIRSFETSQSSYGMYVKYLMAGFLAVFAVTMLIQFVSYLFAAVADYLDEPGHVDHEPAAAAS